MRKYRGKRKSDGKWVYGHLGYKYENLDGFYVIGENVDEVARVLPETIGEETGLKAKNGREIYEGDIIGRKGFYHKVIGHNGTNFTQYWTNNPMDSQLFTKDSIDEYDEVIGNIHEHSELIKD